MTRQAAARKLFVLYLIILLAVINIAHTQCPDGNFVKCCRSNGTFRCAGAGPGCAPGETSVSNGQSCGGGGGGGSCSCRTCSTDGECATACGNTNYACYNRQCQRGTNDCGGPE
ncbi:hypothetical protein F5H01DRAFT_332004 [Linnemannia elongata]|nr:hypothetical protein F5H01DRAFT_360165 [Linnemannia elongata]KAK5827657.1 hypothetical protein F5H01DRAFT_332004 [Linnemannia elongata]